MDSKEGIALAPWVVSTVIYNTIIIITKVGVIVKEKIELFDNKLGLKLASL